jgi:hypothetical protein
MNGRSKKRSASRLTSRGFFAASRDAKRSVSFEPDRFVRRDVQFPYLPILPHFTHWFEFIACASR